MRQLDSAVVRPIWIARIVLGAIVVLSIATNSPSNIGSAQAADRSAPTEPLIAKSAWQPLPPSDKPLERIAFGSCLYQHWPQPIWTSIVAAKPQLFLMIGDNVYGDIKSPDLSELRLAYETQAVHTEFAIARRQFPFLATWDDHDYGRDDAGRNFPYRKRARALFDAFWNGSGSEAPTSQDGIYYARTFGPIGRRTQIIMLDNRSFRSPLTRKTSGSPGKGRYRPDHASDKTMLGPEQWSWLAERLMEPADLRLVVSSIQVLAEGHNFERWGNLPVERQRLIALIKSSNASGVIFLSGDRHRAAIYTNPSDDPYNLHEITSSSMNRPRDDPSEKGPYQRGPMYGAANFGMIKSDWDKRTVGLSIHGMDGHAVRELRLNLDSLSAK